MTSPFYSVEIITSMLLKFDLENGIRNLKNNLVEPHGINGPSTCKGKSLFKDGPSYIMDECAQTPQSQSQSRYVLNVKTCELQL